MPNEQRENAATGKIETITYSIPLSTRKEAAWAGAKAYRDSRIDAGVSVPGVGVFDSDEISRGNITGAVTMAMIAKGAGQPFAMGWKLKDNSIVQVTNADAMIGVGVAVGSHVAACHAAAQAIAVAIQAAANVSALDAIDITAGYP